MALASRLARMLCSHLFCNNCIREWLREANSCPAPWRTEPEAADGGVWVEIVVGAVFIWIEVGGFIRASKLYTSHMHDNTYTIHPEKAFWPASTCHFRRVRQVFFVVQNKILEETWMWSSPPVWSLDFMVFLIGHAIHFYRVSFRKCI